MTIVKKSFNVDERLVQSVEKYVAENPGMNFTLVMNQALLQWLKSPKIELKRSRATDADVERFISDNQDLMDDLSK